MKNLRNDLSPSPSMTVISKSMHSGCGFSPRHEPTLPQLVIHLPDGSPDIFSEHWTLPTLFEVKLFTQRELAMVTQ